MLMWKEIKNTLRKKEQDPTVCTGDIIFVCMLGQFQGEDTNRGWQLPLGSGNEGLGWKGF